ncbi:tetratricopeptide repeat protein [Streptomyces sp. OfavH-34-F]|uniref:AfsR/SARP family transcriptional regulator n=1 Tax=Streptomyces sp. OfavH-34-F TaxID=2917760 RepID=UPI001EF2E182|nr:BTAD domain-containing putative transcriptional regulator [Streptomyces sp. OfavH-34-F]MCG7523257.1 tetratricopeptide repeat protein [Streptomyces sp. OfavH-34-F]
MEGVHVWEFRVLGTIEALFDGRRAEVGHLRQRCVLAALLVDVNRAVPVDELVVRVWGDRAPQRAKGTLYGYVSRLRGALSGPPGVSIVRQPGGYLLEADPLSVDVHRFGDLVEAARAADDERASALMRQALELWRGEPFAAVETPWFHDLRHVLERTRFAAELDGTDIRLRCGEHGELLPTLTARAEEHPLDERVAAQLVLALYRSGRPADALTGYHGIRRRLAEELGVDPGAPLQRLHQRILNGDPELDLPAPARSAAPSPAPLPRSNVPTPRQLPAAPRWFIGRHRQLTALDRALDLAGEPDGSMAVSVIGGGSGIGKTRLALHWAHRNLDRFPDGQLYVDLRGFDPVEKPVAPAVVVRGFLDALGVDSGSVPLDAQAQLGLYRSLMQGRRMLIVLDNAANAEQAAALLPGSTSCAVLVTSRRQLAGLAGAHGARLLTLDVLNDAEARDLLAHYAGPDRVAGEPTAVAALLAHCAGLPLALSVVGARATVHPDFPLAVLAEELADESARLDALGAGDLTADVRAAFTVSYRDLNSGAAEVFRLLGLAPGPETGRSAIGSLVARPAAAVRAALQELENAHLLQQTAPGRYRLHDLLRLYAAERAREESASHGEHGSVDEAVGRLVDFSIHTAHTAAGLLDPHRDSVQLTDARAGVVPEVLADHEAALAWFTREHAVLSATIGLAVRAGHDLRVCELAWALETFFDYRGHWHDWAASQRVALEAAERLGDLSWQASAHRSLGGVHTQTGLLDEGEAHFRRALDLYTVLGDENGQAHTHRGLGWVCTQRDHQQDALDHTMQALARYRRTGHRIGQARALNNAGWLRSALGDHHTALHYCVQAVELNRDIGDRHGEAGAWDSLGCAHHHLAQYGDALDCYGKALALDRGSGDRYGETEILGHLGDTHLATADIEAARSAWLRALEIAEEIGHPSAGELRGKLDELGPDPVR